MTSAWNGKPIPGFNHGPVKSVERIPDYMTESGARTLATMLLTVWHKCGHSNVTASAELAGSSGNKSIWRGATNLVNGLPPRAAG